MRKRHILYIYKKTIFTLYFNSFQVISILITYFLYTYWYTYLYLVYIVVVDFIPWKNNPTEIFIRGIAKRLYVLWKIDVFFVIHIYILYPFSLIQYLVLYIVIVILYLYTIENITECRFLMLRIIVYNQINGFCSIIYCAYLGWEYLVGAWSRIKDQQHYTYGIIWL